MSFEEGALGDSRVHLLGLSDHDRLVFQVVENQGFSNSEVLETALDNALFGVCEEFEDLYNILIRNLEIR